MIMDFEVIKPGTITHRLQSTTQYQTLVENQVDYWTKFLNSFIDLFITSTIKAMSSLQIQSSTHADLKRRSDSSEARFCQRSLGDRAGRRVLRSLYCRNRGSSGEWGIGGQDAL